MRKVTNSFMMPLQRITAPFENPTVYATNSEVSESANKPEEHEIQIENVEWTADFWFKFTLRDASGNQIVGIKSQKF